MQLTSLITAAGLAVSASNAFLLPLPTDLSDSDIITTLPIPIDFENAAGAPVKVADFKNVKLSCPGCPVRLHGHRKGKPDGKPRISTEVPSHLELDFTIDSSSTTQRLLLNGFELYPKSDLHSMMTDVLSAKLVPEFKHHREWKKGPDHDKNKKHHHERPSLPLGFGMSVQKPATNQEDGLELVIVNLQIFEVANVFVDGIPAVQVNLLKTNGRLTIGDIGTTPSVPIHKGAKQPECSTLLCKWRAIVVQQFARLRNSKHCGGGPGQVASTHGWTPRPHGFHGQPPHHNMHHGRRPSWGQLFKNIASHILLPIAIGIMAGVTASILGMMVGTAVIFVWRTLFRRGGRRHSCHRDAKKEAAPVEEKAGLMAEQEEEEVDAPPAYADDIKPETNA